MIAERVAATPCRSPSTRPRNLRIGPEDDSSTPLMTPSIAAGRPRARMRQGPVGSGFPPGGRLDAAFARPRYPWAEARSSASPAERTSSNAPRLAASIAAMRSRSVGPRIRLVPTCGQPGRPEGQLVVDQESDETLVIAARAPVQLRQRLPDRLAQPFCPSLDEPGHGGRLEAGRSPRDRHSGWHRHGDQGRARPDAARGNASVQEPASRARSSPRLRPRPRHQRAASSRPGKCSPGGRRPARSTRPPGRTAAVGPDRARRPPRGSCCRAGSSTVRNRPLSGRTS